MYRLSYLKTENLPETWPQNGYIRTKLTKSLEILSTTRVYNSKGLSSKGQENMINRIRCVHFIIVLLLFLIL